MSIAICHKCWLPYTSSHQCSFKSPKSLPEYPSMQDIYRKIQSGKVKEVKRG